MLAVGIRQISFIVLNSYLLGLNFLMNIRMKSVSEYILYFYILLEIKSRWQNLVKSDKEIETLKIIHY